MQLKTPLDVIVERGVIKSQNATVEFLVVPLNRETAYLTALLGVNLVKSSQDREIDLIRCRIGFFFFFFNKERK